MYKFNIVDKLSLILVIIGALNWGILGVFSFNLVEAVLNIFQNSYLSQSLQRIVYILVGASAINIIFLIYKLKFFSKN